jgi:hypothetical protein
MGHSDYRTTSIYADYAPDPSQGALYAAKAFGGLGTPAPDTLASLEQALRPGLRSHPTTNVRSPDA